MQIKFSKKELYRDNCKMRDELNHLLAVNTELVILNEQMKSDMVEINTKIVEYNNRVGQVSVPDAQ